MMEKYEHIVNTIADHYRIPPELIYGRNKKTEVVKIRHLIAYLLRDTCGLTLEHIGRILGGRDHTTILNSLREFNDITYPKLWKDLNYLRTLVLNIEIPSNRWIHSSIREADSIEFVYGENQDLCGIFQLSIV